MDLGPIGLARHAVARLVGRGRRRAEADVALRKALARFAGHRPRALDLRFGGEPVEQILRQSIVVSPRGQLDVASRMSELRATVPERIVEWLERRAYLLDIPVVHGPTGLVLHGGRHVVQSGPANMSYLKHFAADNFVAEELWIAERFGATRKVTGPVHHTGPVPTTYFGWLLYILPKVLAARRLCPDVTVIVPDPPRYARESLDAYGVRYLVTSESVSADGVVVVDDQTVGWPHPQDLEEMRQALSGFSDATDPHINRRGLYISRSGSSRSLRNESLLEKELEGRGFAIFRPESLATWRDQAELFAASDLVIGPHGAGFSNLVFSPEGTRVIELLPPALNQEGTPGQTGNFARLAMVRGFEYRSIDLVVASAAPFGDAEPALRHILDVIDSV